MERERGREWKLATKTNRSYQIRRLLMSAPYEQPGGTLAAGLPPR